MQVIPAVLPHSYDELLEKLERLEGLSLLIQIDLCDGVFGREKTWMPLPASTVPTFGDVKYQYDVMVSDWRPVVETLTTITPQPESIVMHVDSMSDDDLDEMFVMVKSCGARLGLAISNNVEPSVLFNAIRRAREVFPHVFVEVMGIKKVGEQAQFFDEECLQMIAQVSQAFGDAEIQVDGAMSPPNATRVRDAGVGTVVVGSYISRHDDPGTAYGELSSL